MQLSKDQLLAIRDKLERGEGLTPEELAVIKFCIDNVASKFEGIIISLMKSSKLLLSTYEVKSGDTLFGIAKRFTGDGDNYVELTDANPDIHNKHLIYPGQVIKLPSKWLNKPEVVEKILAAS